MGKIKIRLTESNLRNIIKECVKQAVSEVRYINTSSRKKNSDNGRFNQDPLRNNETIRVYHGCGSIDDAVVIAKYGTSGMNRHARKYSYENGMNPHGLFVTVNPDTAFDFASGHNQRVTIEFSAKVSQLDYPVWNGQGSYFTQGSNPQPFRNKVERDIQKKSYQDDAINDKNSPEMVKLSDNPRLAQSLMYSYEFQALFVGNLNPNQIKRFWVHEKGKRWTPYSHKEFLKKYGDTEIADYVERQHNNPQNRVFKPNDDFTSIEDMATRVAGNDKEYIPDIIRQLKDWTNKNNQSSDYYASCLAEYLWPKQLIQLMGEDWFREHCSPCYDDPVFNQYGGKERPQKTPEPNKILSFAQQRLSDGFSVVLSRSGATEAEKRFAENEITKTETAIKELRRLYNTTPDGFDIIDAKQYWQNNRNSNFKDLAVNIYQYLNDGYSLMDVQSDYMKSYRKYQKMLKQSTTRYVKSIDVKDGIVSVITVDAIIDEHGFIDSYKEPQELSFKVGSPSMRRFVKNLMQDENFALQYKYAI